MNFSRTLVIPTKLDRDFKTEKVVEVPDFESERKRAKQAKQLTIKRPLGELFHNFRKVFPNSEFNNLKIMTLDVKGADAPILHVTSQIMSSSKTHAYLVHLNIRRTSELERWSLTHKCEIKCSCPAFKYWAAHPDLLTKNFYGKPSKWNQVRNQVKNPKLIPTMCKHIAFLTQRLITEGVLKP